MSSYAANAADVVNVLQTQVPLPWPLYETMLEIVRLNLPGVLDAIAFCPETQKAQVYPKGYSFFTEVLGSVDDLLWPRVVIGGATTDEELGARWQATTAVNIGMVWPGPTLSVAQVRLSHLAARAAGGIFRLPQFAGPFTDPADGTRKIWNTVLPDGIHPIPTDWTTISGWVATLRVVQTGNCNLW